MSKPKVFEKPSGVKDYLPGAVARLRRIENRVLDCMQSWGYQQIMTPTLEYYDTVGVTSATSDRKLFKLLDKHGTTLVLRSDMTGPIARVVSSLLKEKQLPLRLSYHANVFRAIEEEAGRESEFFQTGVELVGDASAEADAEVVALTIASLKAAGIQQFKIAIGHLGFLNGLFQETLDGRADDQDELKECLLARDYVGYRQVIRRLGLSDAAKSKLEAILHLRGGQEICEQATQLTKSAAAKSSIYHLREVWDVLQAYGVCENVLIDLTMIGDFSYYTGMIFEGYSAELGFPVASGGRYDNLLTQFGRPAPATGFALKTTRILDILSKNVQEEPYRVLILYDAGHRQEAIRSAADWRSREGYAVETRKVQSPSDAAGIEALEDESYQFGGQRYNDIIVYTGEGEQIG